MLPSPKLRKKFAMATFEWNSRFSPRLSFAASLSMACPEQSKLRSSASHRFRSFCAQQGSGWRRTSETPLLCTRSCADIRDGLRTGVVKSVFWRVWYLPLLWPLAGSLPDGRRRHFDRDSREYRASAWPGCYAVHGPGGLFVPQRFGVPASDCCRPASGWRHAFCRGLEGAWPARANHGSGRWASVDGPAALSGFALHSSATRAALGLGRMVANQVIYGRYAGTNGRARNSACHLGGPRTSGCGFALGRSSG